MRAYIAVTDREWFDHLRHMDPWPEEANFWKPSGTAGFQALSLGQPLIFKLHYPENAIVGAGFFGHFSKLPTSLAWDAFGLRNGAATLTQMRARIEKYRKAAPTREDYEIGCILLEEPFFLDEHDWISAPEDFSKNIVSGKGYSLTEEPGKALWTTLLARRQLRPRQAAAPASIYGDPALYRPRLGQGTFRVMVTDAFDRQCAVTREHTLPVLQAAHIKPVAAGGLHDPGNGLLLRSDIHTLFDRGFVTVTPDHRFRVSRQLRDFWQNGKAYYALEGTQIHIPRDNDARPQKELLEWHADSVFRG